VPVASIVVPAAGPPLGDANQAAGEHQDSSSQGENEDRAARALREAFERLAPQGTDAWNFAAAFTHLGDRYGPYHPGASTLSDALEAEHRKASRRGGRLERLRREWSGDALEIEKSELAEAMGHVVEAFRFLSARVATLEERLSAQDSPVDGLAWLMQARPLGPWVGHVAAHVTATATGGEVVHADCGDGALLESLDSRGIAARGVEPRGAVALHALERGYSVTIAEASEYLRRRDDGCLGGIVLSGVVDRLPLHDLVPLLVQCRRTLGRAAPLVVVSEQATAVEAPLAATDLVDGRSLHEATWELLLDRIGFVEVAQLEGDEEERQRFALAASTPS
jgi:hypothetical protein